VWLVQHQTPITRCVMIVQQALISLTAISLVVQFAKKEAFLYLVL
jgi:hypothetical protein